MILLYQNNRHQKSLDNYPFRPKINCRGTTIHVLGEHYHKNLTILYRYILLLDGQR